MLLKCVLSFAILTRCCASCQKNPNQWQNRSTIVHLFEWKFLDVADECERFLQHKGYAGVQVSPVSENVIVPNRPWWERYQPISYKIITRSGNEADFLNMTRRCNAVGIRIYVDIVINHMAANHEKANGTGGSTANTFLKSYPSVPYTWSHFHDTCTVNDYNNRNNVRNCELLGLNDLNQGTEYVRGKIVDFMNKLVGLGVAGFRVDAAKHMWPADLAMIYSLVDNLNTEFGFAEGARPYFYQEVIDMGGEAISRNEYTSFGAVTEFKYGLLLGKLFRGYDKMVYLDSWGAAWSLIPKSEDAVVFIDNHDNQRGHGGQNNNILTYKDPKKYKMAIAFMLAHPYGTPRLMSSFYFNNSDAGPPADESGNIRSPGVNDDDTCSNGWVCEHRWRQIYNMVGFRNAVRGTEIRQWWSNGDQQAAFCRGDKGFIVFTNGGDISRNFNTCLPPGVYCDIISGNLIKERCTGEKITVDNSGFAFIHLSESSFDGMIAIHVFAKE